jgi:hypothetical protein
MDNSIFPWITNYTLTTPAWFGVMQSNPETSAAVLSSSPRMIFINSLYQNIAYRYYKKADWLLGLIGGAAFLFFIILYIPCHFINQSLAHIHAAEELLILHLPVNKETEDEVSAKQLQRVQVRWWYVGQRLLPCC